MIPLVLTLVAPPAAEPMQAYDGPFTAFIVLSDAPQAIYDAWNHGPPNGVKVKALESVAPGTDMEAIIFFAGCTGDEAGRCQVAADWEVMTASGDKVGEAFDAPVCLDCPAPVGPQLLIGENGLGIRAGADVAGYVFRATVKDVVSGRQVTISQAVAVAGADAATD